MQNSKLPKVLVVGTSAWREDGTAHTLMDIFRCWDPDKVALIYTRADLPDTTVCHRYFQISESQVLNSVFKPWMKVGRVVENTPKITAEAEEEHRRYTKGHKKPSSILPLAREFVWMLGRWKSTALKKFVFDFDPDIVFVPIYPTVFMGRIQHYILKLCNKPYVCYLADDNFSYDSCKGLLSYLHRFWLRKNVRWLSTHCKQMFVIVEKEKEETDRDFGTDSIILTKSIDFTNRTYMSHEINRPIKFVYTGSLIIGRDKTLAMIAEAINEINLCNSLAELDIYSQTTPSDEMMLRLNRGSSHFKGFAPRSEMDEIQKEADVVVFAESLEGKSANIARLSFSTKITDYLSNGKCILAVGKEYIAPIDYFRRNDSAIIASNEEQIKDSIKLIVNNPSIIWEYGKKAYDCAVRNHEKQMINKRFIESMINILNK